MTLRNPDVTRQGRILRRIGYKSQQIPRGKNRTVADIRLKSFKNFQPEFPRTLKAPIKVNEDIAKNLARPGSYPIFEDGKPVEYEDSVGDVVDHIGDEVREVIKKNDVSQAKANAIEQEFANFQKLAAQSFNSSIRAELLLQEAEMLCREAGVAPPFSDTTTTTPRPSPPRTSPRPPSPPKEPDKPPPPLTPLGQASVQISASEAKAKLAKAKAVEARKAAEQAAKDALAMRQSLERLQRKVGDAELTAHGLPENRDDAANRHVFRAKSEYRESAQVTAKIYRGVNQRLDRALYLNKQADRILGDVDAVKSCLADVHKETKERQPTQEEINRPVSQELARRGKDRMPTKDKPASVQLARTGAERNDRGRVRYKRAGATVASQTNRLFARPSLSASTEGKELTATIPKIPTAPPYNPRPKDTPGELRDYQKEYLKDLLASGDDSVLVASPTGSGKTTLASAYIGNRLKQGQKVALLAHTDELITQLKEASEAQVGAGKVGVVKGENKDFSKPVTIISHGTVAADPENIIPRNFRPDTLIIDEAHHSAAEGYQDVIGTLKPRKLVGLTATPYREDQLKLADTYDRLICKVEPRELLERGYLVPPTIVDVDLKDKEGNDAKANEAKNLPELYAQAAATARSNGRQKILIFTGQSPGETPTEVVARTKEHLNAVGFQADDILGTTDKDDRQEAIKDFKDRPQGVLVNYGALNEGFDVASVDALVLGRNVGSRGTTAQILGRAIRSDTDTKKRDALILNLSEKDKATLLADVYGQTQARGRGEGCVKIPKRNGNGARQQMGGGMGNRRISRRQQKDDEQQRGNLRVTLQMGA